MQIRDIVLWVFIFTGFISCMQSKDNEQDVSVKSNSETLEIVESDFSISQSDNILLSIEKFKEIDKRMEEYDTISLKKININGVFLGDSAKKVIKILGKPDSIVNTKNEMVDYEDITYLYSKSSFDGHNGILESFYIEDKRFSFENIRAGDVAKSISLKYPKSFKNKLQISENEFVVKIFVTFVPNTIDWYCPDFICLYIKDKVVESIETWTAW